MAKVLAYLLFVGTGEAVAIILFAPSGDDFAVLVIGVAMIQRDQTATSATGC